MSTQPDPQMPVTLTLPLAQVQGLINLLSAQQYGVLAQAGLLDVPGMLIQQGNAALAPAEPKGAAK